MPVQTVEFVARLAIGDNAPDRVYSDLETDEQIEQYAHSLGENLGEFTAENTADCMEDRKNIVIARTITDQAVLEARIVPQGPGGFGLMLTKALVAADAAIVRDAKDMKDAYLKVMHVAKSLGYEDGGHAKCGASKFVQLSVEKPVSQEILLPTIGAVIAINSGREHAFQQVQQTKQRKLEDGFYNDWDPSWHEDYLSQEYPQNFIEIEVTDSPTHGHEADGVILLDEIGFKKNQFIKNTGKMAFAATRSKYAEYARVFGGTDEERERIMVAFPDDLINVSDKIIAKNMPVFALAT